MTLLPLALVGAGLVLPTAASAAPCSSSAARAHRCADLSVRIGALAPAPAAGQTFFYAVGVANHGPHAARATTVTVTLPPGFRGDGLFPPSGCSPRRIYPSPTTLRCALRSVGPGQRRALVFMGVVERSTAPGAVTVSARARSSTPDSRPGNNAAVLRTVVAAPRFASPGGAGGSGDGSTGGSGGGETGAGTRSAFAGSCQLPGEVRYPNGDFRNRAPGESFGGVEERFEATGTCTGTINGRSVSGSARFDAVLSGNLACNQPGRATGSGSLELSTGDRVTFSAEETRAIIAGTTRIQGDLDGSVQGALSPRDGRTPFELNEECENRGATRGNGLERIQLEFSLSAGGG